MVLLPPAKSLSSTLTTVPAAMAGKASMAVLAARTSVRNVRVLMIDLLVSQHAQCALCVNREKATVR
jgi:hypothetical protein